VTGVFAVASEVIMKSLVLLVLVLALVAPGCKKKPQPAPADTSTPAPAPTPAPNTAGAPSTAGGGNTGGNQVSVVPTGAGGGVVLNTGGVGGGGGGAAQAVRKAARRANSLNEMKNIGEIIESMRDEFGKMPTKEAIVNELKKTPTLYAGVNDGAYILTGTTEGGGMWAYEVDSENLGGIIVVGGRATRANADEVKQYMRR